MTVRERIEALRRLMRQRGIALYIVPTSDFHESEYVGDYFKLRSFLSGFTGSAGTLVVAETEAGLWTDGRYFVQAAGQLEGSGIDLYRMGEEGVPTVERFVQEKLPVGGVLGFDGRVVNSKKALVYERLVREKKGRLAAGEDLAGMVWTERPRLSREKIWILAEEYSGESAKSKLARIREKMREEKADLHLISSLCDIAWILNLRGNDIRHVPVFLSYLLIGQSRATLFVQEEALTEEVREYLEEIRVTVRPYADIYTAVREMEKSVCIWMDEGQINYRIRMLLPDTVRVLDASNPSERMKAVKNEVELASTRIAHVRDGLAFTRFMYWIKNHIGLERITEYGAACYLDRCRAQGEHFLDLSFDNISAYQANAAMMHYSADERSAAELRPEGFLLVDSGAHYLEGTTDITRTIVLGSLTARQKAHFTAVCRANLRLANARFLYGCTGQNLDILSRGPLWDLGLDYKCGTGHGVGHLLNVHEGPNGFRWRNAAARRDEGVLEAGMITTDEPGVYLEGEYGIRTENELICVRDVKNEYGQFMRFETITCAPIDLDGIDPGQMSEQERGYLNAYHKIVREKLSPHLSGEERRWLEYYTREI